MGYTSITISSTYLENQARITGMELTEASQEKYFSMKKHQIAKEFAYAEIRDDDKIVLRNHKDFALFERIKNVKIP